MQAAMDRLERFVARRRRLVLGVWIVLLLVVASRSPSQQTKNLTGGGFEVPGSRSEAVAEALKRFPGAQAETLGVVFDNRKRRPGELAAAIDRGPARGLQGRRGRPARPAAAQAAAAARRPADRRSCRSSVTGVARRRRSTPRRRSRKNLDIDEDGRRGVPMHLVGQQALWAGHAGALQEGPREGRVHRLPDRPDRPAGRLRLARRGALPLGARRRRGGASPARSSTSSRRRWQMSIFVTNIASMLGIGVAVDYSLFILARYREELHGGRDPRRGARRSRCAPRAWPSSSPA